MEQERQITVRDNSIHTIPLIKLQAIWSKATFLLQTDTAITPAPAGEYAVIYTIVTLPMLCDPREVVSVSAIQTAYSGFQAASVHILWQLHR